MDLTSNIEVLFRLLVGCMKFICPAFEQYCVASLDFDRCVKKITKN